MASSKKKSKNRKGNPKPPLIGASSPTVPDLQPSSSHSAPLPTEALTSATQSSPRDLAWLSAVFSSLSLDQIESAYKEAGCDLFKAAGILGTPLGLELEGSIIGALASQRSSEKKSKKARPRHVAASSGMISSVIGKGYEGPHSANEETGRMLGEVELKKVAEESERFLCSMLGDDSDIGLGVVRDILAECKDDVQKALEVLLEMSDPTYTPQRTKGSAKSGDLAASLTYIPSEMEDHLFSERLDGQPTKSRQSNPVIEQQVLESLFNFQEVQEMHTKSPMNWRKIVKRLQNDEDLELHSKSMPATGQKHKDGKGDGYHEFRTVAQKNWDLMKTYYQRAALEYSRGNNSHASCLAEKGNYYRDMAREDDERASEEIFGHRNQGIKNTVTIDLHGQHIKEGMDILKRHLMLFACVSSINYLRVITGCGQNGVRRAKLKQSVKSLAAKENIDWTEENSGTIVLKIEGRKKYSFTDADIDEE